MPDIEQMWGADLTLTPSGDIALVDGDDLTRERLLRRLLTAVRSYIFHTTYGAGVPERIGDTLDTNLIMGVVSEQVRKEATVATSPAPKITVQAILNGVQVSIKYTSAITGQQVALTFDASN
jgi:hypothetical protein